MVVEYITNIVEVRHPSYLSSLLDWRKWRITYNGGEYFRKLYLKKFSKREDDRGLQRPPRNDAHPGVCATGDQRCPQQHLPTDARHHATWRLCFLPVGSRRLELGCGQARPEHERLSRRQGSHRLADYGSCRRLRRCPGSYRGSDPCPGTGTAAVSVLLSHRRHSQLDVLQAGGTLRVSSHSAAGRSAQF